MTQNGPVIEEALKLNEEEMGPKLSVPKCHAIWGGEAAGARGSRGGEGGGVGAQGRGTRGPGRGDGGEDEPGQPSTLPLGSNFLIPIAQTGECRDLWCDWAPEVEVANYTQ
jgi:hypothetical protein